MIGKSDAELLAALATASERWPITAATQREPLIQGACLRNPTLPLAEQTGSQLAANHALILGDMARASAGANASVARDLAAGQGRFCGRLLRRGIPSDVDCVHAEAQRFQGVPAAVSAAFWEGIGAGLVEEREAPAIPPPVRELPGADMGFVLYGAGVAVARIHRDGSGAAANSWLQAIPAEDRPAFDRGLGAGEFQ
jgi:hypothetical protein